MIHVLYIESGLGRGGSAISLKYLLTPLDRNRFQPIVLFSNPKADTTGTRMSDDIDIINLPDYSECLLSHSSNIIFCYLDKIRCFFLYSIPYIHKLSTLIKDRKIGMVHLNTDIYAQMNAVIACLISKTPFVCHLRCTRKLTRSEKFIARYIHRFIVLSEQGKEFFVREGIPEDRLSISYDPYDVKAAHAGAKNKPGWIEKINGALKVAVCSRLARGKGHETLLRAIPDVLKVVHGTHFFIMGDEAADAQGYKAELEELIEKLDIHKNITFTGWQREVDAALSHIDILVDASALPEGLRRTLVEAMIHAKPVIASNIGQTKGLLSESNGGFLFEPNNSRELANCLLILLRDADLRRRMGASARDYVTEKFDMHKKSKEIERIYDESLEIQKEFA